MRREEGADQIDEIDRLEDKQSACGPRENQRTFDPQSDPNEDISDIADEQKILRAVLVPVNWSPGEEPDCPADLQPQRDAPGDRGHAGLLYEFSVSVCWELRAQNYRGNLLALTPVPTIRAWLTKLFCSVPMKKRLAR